MPKGLNAEGNTLNLEQEAFCQAYATQAEFFGNGTQSYIQAYRPDMTKPNSYNVVRSEASRLLTKANVLARINELIDASGLNDAFMDKQLLIAGTQNAEMGPKVKALELYAKIHNRIQDKLDITSKGDKLESPILGGITRNDPK